MSSCAVGDGKCRIQHGSAEYLALKMSAGILNYDEELKKMDLDRQTEVEDARKKLHDSGYVDGYKITPKGEKALSFLDECKISSGS